MKRILLSVPHMSGTEEMYVREAFASNWLSTAGPNLTAFEEEFRARIGLPSLALSSGTAAIHLGLRLLEVGPDDEVFCPTLTFVATANPITYLGAKPVFIDSERASWNLDPVLLFKALKERARAGRLPKAVIVVHLFGQCADMDPILEVCEQFGVPVLEDAAEALGASYKGKPAGAFGRVAAFSFNGNKIITTTGGGMLVSVEQSLIERARFWSMQARDPGVSYKHSVCGYNYRMSNVLAGIGRGQLQVLDLRVRQRQAIAARYREALSDVPGISPMPTAQWGVPTNWLSCFLIDAKGFGDTRDELLTRLDRADVEARPIWKPMHLQPLFSRTQRYGGEVAEDLFTRGICLPSSSSLSIEDQFRVINEIRLAARRTTLACTGTLPASDAAQDSSGQIKVLIYGSGTAGASLLRDIGQMRPREYDVVGFVDDDISKQGASIDGSPVLGPGRILSSIVHGYSVREVLIAIPSATGAEMLRVVGHCRTAGIPYEIVAGAGGRADDVRVSGRRPVVLEDITGRTSVRLNKEAMRQQLFGKSVLVTGAGGSIGSEVCRQIAEFHPKLLVGFDLSETALFHLQRELHALYPKVEFHAEIGNIQNVPRVYELLRRYQPASLYHAAAYKHVPMMELHPIDAIENNVFGTLSVAAAARDCGVSDFVMVSSDKAVRPANIMGATKRVAEIVIRSMGSGVTKFVSVRFGNVLGSNGSVVPLFREQIARGGPVTVTHADMERYFMTIPEASQLILQASTMGKDKDIFVLDMGDPVRILDLAETLIELSGLRPGHDIRITFSGIRPGEKLHEELCVESESLQPTDHDRIRIVTNEGLPEPLVKRLLSELKESCQHRDVGGAILKLQQIARDYHPSDEILRQSQPEKFRTAHA